jgi:hypothetical protein
LLTVVAFGPTTALAGSIGFSFNSFTLPDDDSGIAPHVTATFSWDDVCVANCTLRIDMDYLDSNGGQGLKSNAQGYAGVTWDMLGGAALGDQTNADVISPTLVGGQSATAIIDLNDITIDGVSGEETTAHWGVRTDLTSILPLAGTNILSSVGDVTLGPLTTIDFMGVDSLLTGGETSSVESNPPDGIPFSIVDPFTTMLAGEAGDVVLAQSTTTAFLIYDGSLTGIDNVQPLFGTDGVMVPEPGTGLLIAIALVGVLVRRAR